MTENNSSDTLESIFAKGVSAAQKKPFDMPDGGLGFLVPDGYKLEKVPPLEKPLPRIRQNVNFTDIDSFVAYVNKYKDERTVIFALPGHQSPSGKASFIAYLDYHKTGEAQYISHVAHFHPPYSEQWKRWTKTGVLKQAEFAEFIEENRKDIAKPEAASLLDIVSKFRAKKTVDFDSVVYQQTGDLSIGYSEKTEHAGKPGVVIPAQLELGIPVFFKGTLYSVPIFLRFQMQEAAVVFKLKVDRADYIEQDAFDAIAKGIVEQTEVAVWVGGAA